MTRGSDKEKIKQFPRDPTLSSPGIYAVDTKRTLKIGKKKGRV